MPSTHRLPAILCAAAVAFTLSTRAESAPRPAEEAGADAAAFAVVSSSSTTPHDALARLRAGNARFVGGTSSHPHLGPKRLDETATGQHPFATVLGCSDSRVPPELVFDEGIGDIFSIRVAGNVVDTDELGSAEYGIDHLGTPLLVVMGHTKCGAVTAVATHAVVHGHIPALVEHITPAVAAVRTRLPHATDAEIVPDAIKANVYESMATLIRESDAIRERIGTGKIQVVGAVYDLGTGSVEWLGRHPDEVALLGTKGANAHAPSHAAPRGEDTHARGSGAAMHDDVHAMTAAEAPLSRTPPIPYAIVAFLCTLAGAISQRLSKRAT